MSNNSQAIARVLQRVLRSGRGKLPTPWLLLGCVLLGGYLFAEPWLEDSWQVNLPGLHRPGGSATQAEAPPTKPRTERPPVGESKRPTTVDDLIQSDRETYTSPAGLRYSHGTVHGHHLRHLMAHTRDEPDRPVHGVFDSNDAREVVRLVDQAYEQAVTGRGVQERSEGDRTVYVVDMGHRVGYVGGQSGARRGQPAANRIQLVLIGKKFITAYPR